MLTLFLVEVTQLINSTIWQLSMTNVQKKVKTSHFILSRQRVSFDFHQILHDDRGPPCHHCTTHWI